LVLELVVVLVVVELVEALVSKLVLLLLPLPKKVPTDQSEKNGARTRLGVGTYEVVDVGVCVGVGVGVGAGVGSFLPAMLTVTQPGFVTTFPELSTALYHTKYFPASVPVGIDVLQPFSGGVVPLVPKAYCIIPAAGYLGSMSCSGVPSATSPVLAVGAGTTGSSFS
jgi:hypothetical protein